MMPDMGRTGWRKNQDRASRRLVLALLGALGAAAAAAQQMPATAPAPTGSEVEIIVFRLLDQSANTPETERPARLPAAVAPAADPASANISSADAGVPGYPTQAPASLQLGGIAARLRRSGRYELLYHGGWVQDIAAQNRAGATPLPAEALRAGMQGSVTLYRERYLHALVDIRLARQGSALESWRIRQARRLRGQAVQYFDHPQFGVILAVRAGPADQAEATP